MTCCIESCTIKTRTKNCFELPENPVQRRKWYQFIKDCNGRIPKLKLLSVCEQHFQASDVGKSSDRTILLPGVVPSIKTIKSIVPPVRFHPAGFSKCQCCLMISQQQKCEVTDYYKLIFKDFFLKLELKDGYICSSCFTSLKSFKKFKETIITKHATHENNVPEKLRQTQASQSSSVKQVKATIAPNQPKQSLAIKIPTSARPIISSFKLPKGISVKHIPRQTKQSEALIGAPEITPTSDPLDIKITESDPLNIETFKQEDGEILEAKDVNPLDDEPEVEYEFVEQEANECIKPSFPPQNPTKIIPQPSVQKSNMKEKLLASLREKWKLKLKPEFVKPIVIRNYDPPQPISTERNEKSMFCDFCGFHSANREIMQRHLNVWHIEDDESKFDNNESTKKYVKNSGPLALCSICGKMISESFIKLHISTVHGKRKIHQCETCGKSFKIGSALLSHRKTHSKSKKLFSCDLCDFHGARLQYLKKHIKRMHRPKYLLNHKCRFCQKAFMLPCKLRKHLSTHPVDEIDDGLKAKPDTNCFHCPHCDQRFLKKILCQKHIQVKHN